MFINSKKKFEINLANGECYYIPKDYIGEIPDSLSKHWMIQAAITDGSIATPNNTKTSALESADQEAQKRAKKSDIRKDPE